MSEIQSIIQRLSGQAAFEKGKSLFESNTVLDFSVENEQIRGQVQGSFVYDVSLTIIGKTFDGGCSCPASEGFDICKHCVAVLLQYEQRISELDSLLNEGPAERVEGYINTLPAADLKKALFEFVKKDQEILSQWVMFADINLGIFEIKALKKEITKSLPLKDLWKYEQVRNYFSNARLKVQRLLAVIEKLEADVGIELIEYGLLRYDKVMERIDDSGGFRFGVYYLLERSLVDTFHNLAWDVDRKVDFLNQLNNIEFLSVDFGDIGLKFIQPENKMLEKQYYKTLEATLKSTMSPANKKRIANSLVRYLIDSAQLKKAAEIKASVASSVKDFEVIIDECVSNNELSLASKYIKRAQGFAQHPAERDLLIKASLNIAIKQKDYESAISLAWSTFEQSFSNESYQVLLSLYNKTGSDVIALMANAEELILTSIQTDIPERLRNYEPIISFYLETGQFEKAYLIADVQSVSENQLHVLSYTCLTNDMPHKALTLYKKLIHQYVSKGTKNDYQIAIDLMLELEEKSSFMPDGKKEIKKLYQELISVNGDRLTFVQLLQLNFSEL